MFTQKQQCVFDWLEDKLQLTIFAEAYKGALFLLNEKPPSYITFVAHTGRELMNSLARTCRGIGSSQVQYVQHVDKIQNVWKDDWRAQGFTTSDDGQKGHLIPFSVCQKVKDMIEDHKAGRLRNDDADMLFFSTFLDYSDKDKIPKNFLSDWKAAKQWFQKHTHLRDNELSSDASSEVVRHFKVLDELLYVAASSEFERIKGIHDILEETNR